MTDPNLAHPSAQAPLNLREAIWDNMPESKLELVEGRLLAGNSVAGSRYLLWAILSALGPQAALALAPIEDWWQALASAFRAPSLLSSPRAWQAWAAQIEHTPQIAPAGLHFDWTHHEVYSDLTMELFAATHGYKALGQSIQRFVMRLGDDAFMPDVQVIRADRLHRIETNYLDGPANIVVEIALPGHVAYDAVVKRRRYALGGVSEYWLVDPHARTFEILRLTGDGYVAQALDDAGQYRSASLPGLICTPARLWAAMDTPDAARQLRSGVVTVDPAAVGNNLRTKAQHDPWYWDRLPFRPPIGLPPTPISFEQFIAWCPEAKFELVEGKPHIGGWKGTRDVLGLLLMTFGLEEAVTLLHPREWVAGLLAEEEARQQDAGRRDAWWSAARQVAELLRERFGIRRLAVIGELVRPAPLHYWSEITLVAWDLPRHDYELYHALYELINEPNVTLINAQEASPSQRDAIAREAVEL